MTTDNKIQVKLKRVAGLKRGDVIVPGLGMFRRDGTRLAGSQKLMTDAWGREPWAVTGLPWMNDVPEMNVPVVSGDDPSSQSILHTSLDAYVVLV